MLQYTLDEIQTALTYYFLHKESHSSSILRLFYIDKENEQKLCVDEVMDLIRKATQFARQDINGTQSTNEGSNSPGRNHH